MKKMLGFAPLIVLISVPAAPAEFAWKRPGASPFSKNAIKKPMQAAEMFASKYSRASDVERCVSKLGLTGDEVAYLKLALENDNHKTGKISYGDRLDAMCFGNPGLAVTTNGVVADFRAADGSPDKDHYEPTIDVRLRSGKIVRIPQCGNISVVREVTTETGKCSTCSPSHLTHDLNHSGKIDVMSNGSITIPVSVSGETPVDVDVGGKVTVSGDLTVKNVQTGVGKIETHIYHHNCDGFLSGLKCGMQSVELGARSYLEVRAGNALRGFAYGYQESVNNQLTFQEQVVVAEAGSAKVDVNANGSIQNSGNSNATANGGSVENAGNNNATANGGSIENSGNSNATGGSVESSVDNTVTTSSNSNSTSSASSSASSSSTSSATSRGNNGGNQGNNGGNGKHNPNPH